MTVPTTSPTTSPALSVPGFADPVHEAQLTFRAVLDAMARPTRPVEVPTVAGPGSLTVAGAAVLLTLCDDATPLWLDDGLRGGQDEVEAWLAFHTGAPVVARPSQAAFVVISRPSALPELSTFADGTDEAPHTSATIIVLDPQGEQSRRYLADGPGFEVPSVWIAPDLGKQFEEQWAGNRARFPRGVDLIIAGHSTVVGLPRTTRLMAERTAGVH